MAVVSADGRRLGHAAGFLVDGNDRITHFVLDCGRLLGRRSVAISLGAVVRIGSGSLTIDLLTDDVRRLPVLSLRCARSALPPGGLP